MKAKISFEADEKRRIVQLSIGALIFFLALVLPLFRYFPAFFIISAFMGAYLILGGNIVLRALKGIVRGRIFDENFLMSLATIGAIILGEYPEAVTVMLFYQIGEFFQELAVNRSKKSISALLDIRPDYANLLQNGNSITVSPQEVAIGDLILVKAGEKIPLDGTVIEGEAMVDTRALTGESVPCRVKAGDTVLSGCINQNGLLQIKVSALFGQSTVAKIINLVENASSKKAPTEQFITRFSRYYTPVVVIMASLIAFVPPLLGLGEVSDWVRRGLVFLVISCPCALVISIPLGFFGGIGGASRQGILIKGGNYLEILHKLSTVVFDKTGTLTKGVFKVREILPEPGFTQDEVLEYAAYGESYSNHPIALSVLEAHTKSIDMASLSQYKETPGLGVHVVYDNKRILVGNKKHLQNHGVRVNEGNSILLTGTVIHVARDNSCMGSILIADEVKEDSKDTITALKKTGGIKTVMLSGDDPDLTKAVAEELGIDEYYGGLLPHEKVAKIEMLSIQKNNNQKVAFIGDGINDAPVLARSDLGIAMGGLGSDAAIEAADVVFMTDEPSKLLDAISIAKFTRRIVVQNIVLALGVKAVFMVLGGFGLASMWEAVFADVGVALMATLNATRVMGYKRV